MSGSALPRRAPKTLERVLSRAGLASRAEATRWIRAGRVRVNGVRAHDPGQWVDPALDAITIDDRPLVAARPTWVLLHKPAGYVTSADDERGRRTVYELLEGLEGWVAPVGRLDRDTSGLLLFTNESELAARLLEPEHEVEKLYRARARPALSRAALEALERGPRLQDGPTRPTRVRLVEQTEEESLLEIGLVEGRNRQVRRMLEAVGSRVSTLERVAFGPLRLAGLAPGAWRPLARREVQALARAAGVSRPRGS